MIDHITLNVTDLAASTVFYERALAPLGMRNLHVDSDTFTAFGTDRDPIFEIAQAGDELPAAQRVHVAFRTSSRSAVQEFHAAAIAAGGAENGTPGLRPDYGPTYYAAFVRDPDGNNIEAMCL